VGSYGYRGRDARCNVYQLPTGEIVYFVAAVVVLYNADEQMQRHYIGHTDDIKWYGLWLQAEMTSHSDIHHSSSLTERVLEAYVAALLNEF